MRMLNFPSQYRQGEAPYDIFKNRMSAVGSIVEGIKGIILNKYNKGVMDTIIGQVEKARTEQETTDMINLLTSDPGEEIYPGGIEETAGQFVDTFNMMGKLAQKESLMGGQRSMLGMPPTTPTSEVRLPQGDKSQLLNAVMSMPEGQMDFAPILKYIQENRPKFAGSMSPTEQWALNQAMGQVENPKEELGKGLDLANKYLEYTQEPGEKRQGKYPYSEEEVKEFEEWKTSQKPDISKLIETISQDPDIELTNFNVSSTGTYSYSFKPKDTTTAWEFNTWEEAEAFAKTHPQEGFIPKIETNKQGFNVNWYQKTGTTTKPPTIYESKAIEEILMNNVENATDFAYEMDKLKSQGKDTSFYETDEYYGKLMKKKYDEALTYVNYALSKINAGIDKDEEGNHKQLYKEYYAKLENYDKEYFNVTNEHLLKEELKEEGEINKTIELAKEMVAEKKSLEDLDLDKIKTQGIDIEELKRQYMKLYLGR